MNHQMESSIQHKAPLEGLKILDLSVAWMGPETGRIMASFGAEVIKVESIFQHEIGRVSAPYKKNVTGINHSLCFAAFNTGKYSVTLNLKHPRSTEVLNKLISRTDIILENFIPGVAEKYGLDYENLRKLKPDIIDVSLSTQGLTGPYSMHPGYGFQLLALGGFSNFTGWPDREPCAPVGSYTDFLCPWFAVSAAMSALDYRLCTGKGQHIDVSQLEISPQFYIPAILDYTANNRIQARNGNRSPHASPYGAYRCQGDDRWCVISVFNHTEWESFCRVIGSPEWTNDAKFSTLSGRKDNEDEMDKLVEAWTVFFTPEEVMSMMQASGVASGIVQTVKDMAYDPQLNHRGHFQIMEHAEMGTHICEGIGFHLSKYQLEWTRPAPCLGEHNEFVYTKLLGMSEDDFIDLLNDGLFE